MAARELATQTTCRADDEKCAAHFAEIGPPAPASCLKGNGFRGPTPALSRGSTSDLADSDLTNRRSSRAPSFESIPRDNSSENAVRFPQQTKTSEEFPRAPSCRSSSSWLHLSSARPKPDRLGSQPVAGIRQSSFAG